MIHSLVAPANAGIVREASAMPTAGSRPDARVIAPQSRARSRVKFRSTLERASLVARSASLAAMSARLAGMWGRLAARSASLAAMSARLAAMWARLAAMSAATFEASFDRITSWYGRHDACPPWHTLRAATPSREDPKAAPQPAY